MKIKPSPLPDEINRVWRPPERISIPDWVEKYVKLPRFTSAEPGRLRISRTPYTRGPLKAIGSKFIEQIVLVWGRQLGKTQGVQYPFLCYAICQDPGPAICLFPTIDKAKYSAKRRLIPMFYACDPLRDNEMTSNPDDITMFECQFRAMTLSMAWGGSETQLTTRPARYLFRDEIDELKKAVGENAVDPMSAIEQTTSNFPNRKIIDTSTPTTPTGNVWSELKKCQHVFEYWIPCPHCGTYQILYWDNVRFGDDLDPLVVETVAFYECESCRGEITNANKILMLGEGEWRARNKGTEEICNALLAGEKEQIENTIDLDTVLKNHHVKKIGFHLPKWYSPFSGGTFGVIAREYLEAKKILDDGNDFAPMRNWKIYNAAVPYEEKIQVYKETGLESSVIDIPEMICPHGTVAITAGIDPGQRGFWFVVVAWKSDYSAHVIHYGFLHGSYESSGINELVRWTYPIEKADENEEERRLKIWRIGIDTGGYVYKDENSSMTAASYEWIRNQHTTNIFGVKGSSSEGPRRIKESRIDKMPGESGRIIPGGLTLIELNTNALKDVLWFRVNIETEKPGRLTFHRETGRDFFSHLVAEEKRLQKNGVWKWEQVRKDNHWLDCLVIAMGMADSEFRGGIRVLRPHQERIANESQTNRITKRPMGEWIKSKRRVDYAD